MKITIEKLKIENEGIEVLHIENFGMILKSNIFKNIPDVLKASVINETQKATKME